MRILFVTSNLDYGGAETQLIRMNWELVRRGHEVALFTVKAGNPRARELDGSGVLLRADGRRCGLDLSVLHRLRRFIQAFRPDIIHGYLFDGDLYSRLSALGTGIPVLNSERNDGYRLGILQQIAHWPTRRLADGIVANSHAGGRFAQKLFGMPSERVHVLWNSISLAEMDARMAQDASDRRGEFLSRGGSRIACLAGSIKPQKGYELALETADLLTRAHPEWRVVFIGDCRPNHRPYKAHILRRFGELKLEGRAVFAGLRRRVPEMIGAFDVLYSTSLHEGFPNVVLEAMAVGTPVVSTEYSDIRRILPEPWQVTGRDAPSMVASILKAYELRAQVAARQRAWVEAHANTRDAAARLEAIYRRYVRGRTSDSTGMA